MSSRDEFQLVLLPGLACDQRLFARQRSHFPKAFVPDWPTPDASIKDLPAYAAVCLDTWTNANVFELDQPYFLLGTSFGGLVALELGWLAAAREKPPIAVLLISSCRSWQAVPRWYGRWSSWATKLPHWVARAMFARRHVASARHSTHSGTLDKTNSEGGDPAVLVEAMLQSTDWKQLIYFTQLMSTWRREPSEVAGAPFAVHQLHGRTDTILPKPSPAEATLLLDAGHWMCATHPVSVNNWIDAILQDSWLRKRGPKPIKK